MESSTGTRHLAPYRHMTRCLPTRSQSFRCLKERGPETILVTEIKIYLTLLLRTNVQIANHISPLEMQHNGEVSVRLNRPQKLSIAPGSKTKGKTKTPHSNSSQSLKLNDAIL